MKILIIFGVIVAVMLDAWADDATYMQLVAQRDALKQQIAATESEITRCEKSLKTWKIATIVGGVGAAATGVGAIVQNQKIKENNTNIKNMRDDYNEALVYKELDNGVAK